MQLSKIMKKLHVNNEHPSKDIKVTEEYAPV